MKKFKTAHEAMLHTMVKTEMVDYVHRCMTESMEHAPTKEALSEFFSAEGKKKIGGCNYWQQCFAIEKALEFYHERAQIATVEMRREHETRMERLVGSYVTEEDTADDSGELHG